MIFERSEEYIAGKRFFDSLSHAVKAEIRGTSDSFPHPMIAFNNTLKDINESLGRDKRSGVDLGEFVDGLEGIADKPTEKMRRMDTKNQQDELRNVLDRNGVAFEPSDVDNLQRYLTLQRIEGKDSGKTL